MVHSKKKLKTNDSLEVPLSNNRALSKDLLYNFPFQFCFNKNFFFLFYLGPLWTHKRFNRALTN